MMDHVKLMSIAPGSPVLAIRINASRAAVNRKERLALPTMTAMKVIDVLMAFACRANATAMMIVMKARAVVRTAGVIGFVVVPVSTTPAKETATTSA
jgi:hypothetical protein